MASLSGFFRALIPARFRSDAAVVPVVRLAGVIGAGAPLRPGLTLAAVARNLERAFDVKRAKAVAVVINSPGGSPTQSHLIYRRIRSLAEEKKLPVLTFIEDAGASGGYMLACAGDEIIADVFSIVGSIGVVGGAFGFPKLMQKLGIERRVYTAGERKVMLDPFLPEKPDDVRRIKAIQKDIHDNFITLVKERRGKSLKGADKTLFSGEFWTAPDALKQGLIDQIGDVRSVLRERYGKKVRTPLIAEQRKLFGMKLPVTRIMERFDDWAGGGLTADVVSAVEARAWWARIGL
jgi:serine protease SohB